MVFDQASRNEIALIAKYWRVTNELLEYSTDLDNVTESRHRIVWDGKDVS